MARGPYVKCQLSAGSLEAHQPDTPWTLPFWNLICLLFAFGLRSHGEVACVDITPNPTIPEEGVKMSGNKILASLVCHPCRALSRLQNYFRLGLIY